MAGSEIYRVEIPIIVDDQTEAPMRQAEERVSRFQRQAEKQTKMVREHMTALAKMQIEPVMRVKDQLTNSVINADRLIKKLGMEEASPLIEAQDRASAVVARVDAALQAVDRGDVKVIAEMQGPLMDEIVKAKASLKALEGVRAGPVAELRGELFGQLTRAFTEARKLDQLMVEPRATLRERVTWKAREIGGELRRLTSRGWEVTIRAKDKVTGAVKSIANRLTSPLALLGVGGGVAGVTGMGLGMVMEEQDLVSSFEVMLGSRQAAEKRMQELITFAGQTPFTRQEIWRSSRQLELMTKGALATGEGLRLVGDVAAGTVQPFEDVAMWFGRLYDGMASGRPIGEATSRLQEMGAISGEARAKLEKLADSGRHISETWPQAAKEFERFNGLMEKQSKNLRNIMLGTKTFFTENVIKKWGLGVADMLQPALMRFRVWRSENKEAVKQLGNAVEQFGRRVGGTLVGYIERAVKRMSDIMSDPRFKHATFSEKVRMLVSAAMDDVIAWLDGPGKEKLTNTFVALGEASIKAYIAGMKALGAKAIDELKEGNAKGAAVPAAAMYLLGGGALARGAWNLGKGVLRGGKWLAGKLPRRGVPAEVVAEMAATAEPAVTRAGGIGGRVLPTLGRLKPWLGRIGVPVTAGIEAINIARAEDKRKAAVSGTGRIAGMAAGGKAGMMAGGAIGSLFGGAGAAPGAVIGGILGGIGGFLGGEAVAEKLNAWLDKVDFGVLKEKALSVWDGIKQKASETWTWIKENINLETLTEGAGYVLGYLEGTIFNGEWWLTKWENVKAWAAEKWASMVEVWENAKETISNTLLNGEWWLAKWEAVRAWTKETWNGAKEIWETVKTNISETLFSKDWWLEKWAKVKSWGMETLNNIAARWDGMKESFKQGKEAGKQAAATKYAMGGILTTPHLGLVAEAGPEAIIPLSTGMRPRALKLWEETGKRLGVQVRAQANVINLAEYRNIRAYASGGFAGAVQSMPMAAGWDQPVPVGSASSFATSGATINLNFDLAGLVDQVIIESKDDIDRAVDKITDAIADNLRKVFQNMTK